MTETEVGNDGSGQPVSMGALFVRALLDRRGVARHRQATLIAEILGLSYAQSHRRLGSGGGGSHGGGAPWTIDDVARVAQHFGESLSDMVANGAGRWSPGPDGTANPQDEAGSVAAVFVVDGLRWLCRAWIGEPVEVVSAGSLVARFQGSANTGSNAPTDPNANNDRDTDADTPRWEIRPAAHVSAAAQAPALNAAPSPLHAVQRLVIVPEQARRFRVAVLDDDRDVADSLSEQFREAGLAAQAFYSAQELSAVLTVQPFDAYVLDWILGKDTALSLVKAIRSADLRCPIAMLTGQLISKRADESEVVAAMQTWRLMFYEKPVRAFIVAAALKQALTQTTQTAHAALAPPRMN